MDCLQREVREEVGAELLSCKIMGAFHCTSYAEKPYRSHLSHPESFRLICTGEVKLVRAPTNPHGDEQVKRVDVVPLDTVVERFQHIERFELADLYRLSADMAVSGPIGY